jgi:ATP-binding cassette subfamily B protein
VTELTRCALLAELPGERLNQLAKRMTREEVAAGAAPVVEGEAGDRFYIVLSGVLAVSRFGGRGAAGVLHPGAYFGEVALAMGVPRTASVRAMTPSVVASCDKATFDELIRPLFADESES